MSPDEARHILRSTLEEATREAGLKVQEDGRRRYIVEIVAVVEQDKPPIKITPLRVDEREMMGDVESNRPTLTDSFPDIYKKLAWLYDKLAKEVKE